MKKLPVLLFIVLISFFQYCGSSKKAAPGNATTTTANSPAHSSLTYAVNIQPTIIANCSPCHIPPKGFKTALDTYNAARENIGNIISRIQMNPGDRGFMPFKHEKLSDSLIHIFVQWKADGLVEK